MILVTGAAGFIGYHLCSALLERGEQVIGIDSINDYYDPQIKHDRLGRLQTRSGFSFHQMDICDYSALSTLFSANKIDRIVHLAAQAGVRFSITNPFAYQKANSEGFLNIIECARHNHVKNFVYASSSSVYGGNTKLPFSESDRVDNPVSLYAATKKANELVAHCYSHLFQLPTSGLRFFTVYGPWGRPDMALFLFTRAILEGKPIDVFNNGQMLRNFTYIDDIVNGIQIALDNPRPYEVYNIGNNRAENLMDFIAVIEQHTGHTAQKRYLPMQPGDVPATVADISKLAALGYAPLTNIDKGVSTFVQWYRDYYKV